MRKQIKTWAVLGLAAALTASMAGCASSQSGSSETAAPQAPAVPQDPDKAQTAETTKTEGSEAPAAALEGEIEIVTNGNEETFNAVNEILNNFMAENPGVTISYTTQGSDYEQLMKARMASNDLPDIFATHGWSVARYSEYLTPLNDQPWYGSIEESFMNNIANDEGQIFVLPLNMDIGGLLYNKTLLEELNAEIPKTWDQLLEICEMGKAKGYTGVFIAGKDSRQPAFWMSPPRPLSQCARMQIIRPNF